MEKEGKAQAHGRQKEEAEVNFDAFASGASRFVSRAIFFAGCVALVIIWLPTYLLVGSFDTWQLLINTPTTIVTFLLVALIQNTQTRFENATNEKLNALAEAVADLMSYSDAPAAQKDCERLRNAMGLEEKGVDES